MGERRYSIIQIDGLKPSERRAVVLLACKGDAKFNALAKFEKLKPARARELKNRFDYWIVGGKKDQWFHGWPTSKEHRSCFVFKWRERGQHQRFYDFLCHPRQDSSPAFQVCVLAFQARKKEYETDRVFLDRAAMLKNDKRVIAALKKTFMEE